MDFFKYLQSDGLLGVLLVPSLAVERPPLDLGAHDKHAVGRIPPLERKEITYTGLIVGVLHHVV